MEILQDDIQSIPVLTPKGRIDTVSANDLELKISELIEQDKNHIVINFSEVDLISSAGLRVLLMMAKRLKPREGNLLLCGLDETVYEVFEISGFSKLFSIFATSEEAVATLS